MESKLLKMTVSGLFAAAAAAAFVGCSSDGSESDEGATAEAAPATEVITGECWGANACKGKGDCGGKGHSCAGKNACKGKGWKKLSESDCKAQKGKWKKS